jgi:hypothetical protein
MMAHPAWLALSSLADTDCYPQSREFDLFPSVFQSGLLTSG